MNKKSAVTVILYLFLSKGVSAAIPEGEWEQFKAQFAVMSERLTALEIENERLRQANSRVVMVEDLEAVNAEVATLRSREDASSWAESLMWKGDFRYRYEDIRQENAEDRDRNRIRARPALVARVTETTEVGFGMATGGDDPVSTNETLGGGGSTKDVRLDLAYATWTGLENTALTAGKFANPYYRVQKSQLIWDSDFRPEGLAVQWANDTFFANASYAFIESDSARDNDGIWGGQLGGAFEISDGLTLTASAAYLDFPSKGRRTIYDDDFFGNSAVQKDGETVYAFDYQVASGSLDITLQVFDIPLNVYGEYVKNSAADEFDSGYIAGVKLGKAKKPGSWQLQYQYEDLEADAVLGLYTDSDFAGGGSDGKGSKFAAKYAIDSQWSFAATYFYNKRGVDLGDNEDYKRLQLDTLFKY